MNGFMAIQPHGGNKSGKRRQLLVGMRGPADGLGANDGTVVPTALESLQFRRRAVAAITAGLFVALGLRVVVVGRTRQCRGNHLA
jgi:hypothetical protein